MIHAGKWNGTHYVLDVESGSLHVVDELIYDICVRMENGQATKGLPYSKQQIDEALLELGQLQQQGMFDSPSLIDESAPVFNKPVVKAMCLHVAHDCNLRCAYCFADEGAYKGKREMMSEDTAKAAIDFLLKHSEGRYNLELDFFGGEPLINFGVVKAATLHGREHQGQKNIRFTMTTNAYSVTDEMVEFLNDEMKNIVISIDGRKQVHNSQRKNAAGQGSYDKVVSNAKKIVAGRGDKEYYIRGTYTAKNMDFSNDVLAIAAQGFDQISVEPVVTGGQLALKPEHLKDIREQYDILARHIYENKDFNFFHFMLDFSSGPCLNKRLRGCGAGSEYVAVAPNGDIYPCHQFVGVEEYKLGNVHEQTFNTAISEKFMECHVLNKPECKSCWAKYFCSGGCAADAYNTAGDIMKPSAMSCEIEKIRLETAIGLYAKRNENSEEL